MIIDADTHVSPYKEPGIIQIPVEELLSQMETSKVDKALCWLTPPYMREIDASLKYVYEYTKKYPDKLLGFGWADPHFGVKKGKETVKKCLNEYGFYGIKLNGAQNSFPIDNEEMCFPIIEEVAKAGSILAFHIGVDAYDFTHPSRAVNVARRFPEMPILMVHMGGVGAPELTNACIQAAEQCGNMHLIGSNVRFNSVVNAIRKLGASRVSFGSDTPFSIMHADLAAYKAILSDYFTKKDEKLVLGENIVRLFKLG